MFLTWDNNIMYLINLGRAGLGKQPNWLGCTSPRREFFLLTFSIVMDGIKRTSNEQWTGLGGSLLSLSLVQGLYLRTFCKIGLDRVMVVDLVCPEVVPHTGNP